MAKKIKWTGSLDYDMGGGKKLFLNQEYTLSDKEVATLPQEGYKVLQKIKEEPVNAEINSKGTGKENEDPNAGKGNEDPNAGKGNEDPGAGKDNEDPNKGEQNSKPEEDELLKDLTPDQLAFYTANTINTLKQKAQAATIEIPASITKKAEIFRFMLDQDFNIA